MYFDAYKKHTEAVLNPALLWEYDLKKLDYKAMRNVIIQRVVERGWLNDWYASLHIYGEQEVIEAIKSIPYLNDKDMNFVSIIFQIPLNQLACYERKQLRPAHWNS